MLLGALFSFTLAWQPSLDAAIERAAIEKNIVVVAVSNDCHGCADRLEGFVRKSAARAPIAYSYGRVILARAAAGEAAARGIRTAARAAIVVLDPAGTIVADWTDFEDMNGYSAFLAALRQERVNLARAAALRAAGQAGQADFFVANALLQAGRAEEAWAMLGEAAIRMDEAGDASGAEWARLRRAIADLTLRRTDRALQALRVIAEKPVDAQNAASAWLVLAEIYQSQRRERQATEAYQNAQKLAAKGTGVAAAAGDQIDLLQRRVTAERADHRGERAAATQDVVFSIDITSPAAEEVGGPVTVTAEPRVPASRRLEGVDFFWNEQKIGTRSSAPFRADFDVPPAQLGYFRAVGKLDDGSVAEDSVLVNAGKGAEQVEVQGVNFVAAVRDLLGRRMAGLTARDFHVREDGQPVEVAVQQSTTEPVTIGIALDTSSSIRSALLDVQEVAASLVDESIAGGGAAFLVGFDSRPRLLQSVSTDAPLLKDKLYDLRASGATSINDAIAFALRFFTGVKGKRALVVLSDGFDTASGFSTDVAATAAREAGVPVYVVLHGLGSGPGRSPSATMTAPGNNLRRMVEQTGGRIFEPVLRSRLDDVFRTIRDEVGAQYVLSYQSPSGKPNNEWRNVSVEVPGRGAVVKTISGYVPR
jgi:VWFA-related protein